MEKILNKHKAELNAHIAQNADKIIENLLDRYDARAIYAGLNDIIYNYSRSFLESEACACMQKECSENLQLLMALRDVFYSF